MRENVILSQVSLFGGQSTADGGVQNEAPDLHPTEQDPSLGTPGDGVPGRVAKSGSFASLKDEKPSIECAGIVSSIW